MTVSGTGLQLQTLSNPSTSQDLAEQSTPSRPAISLLKHIETRDRFHYRQAYAILINRTQ